MGIKEEGANGHEGHKFIGRQNTLWTVFPARGSIQKQTGGGGSGGKGWRMLDLEFFSSFFSSFLASFSMPFFFSSLFTYLFSSSYFAFFLFSCILLPILYLALDGPDF